MSKIDGPQKDVNLNEDPKKAFFDRVNQAAKYLLENGLVSRDPNESDEAFNSRVNSEAFALIKSEDDARRGIHMNTAHAEYENFTPHRSASFDMIPGHNYDYSQPRGEGELIESLV